MTGAGIAVEDPTSLEPYIKEASVPHLQDAGSDLLRPFGGPAATGFRRQGAPVEPAPALLRLEFGGSAQDAGSAIPARDPDEAGLIVPLDNLDATDYDHLVFGIRSPTHDGAAALELQLIAPDPDIVGLWQKGIYSIPGVGKEWQHIAVPLNAMVGLRNWRHIAELRLVVRNHPVDQRSEFWLADVRWVKTSKPGPSLGDLVVAVRKSAWETSVGGAEAAKPHLRNRLVGWPNAALVETAGLPTAPKAFLKRLASDTWRGIDALVDKESGLPLDNVRFGLGNPSVAMADVHIGDYSSTTNIGLHLAAVVAAMELGLIERSGAVARVRRAVDALSRMETYRGFFFNYYNTMTLERTSNFVSFVDSAWLTAGLMVAKHALPELREVIDRLIEREDYRLFYDERHGLMSHGYYVNLGQQSPYHYGVLFAEARLGSLIAIGKQQVPPSHWFSMARTFPAEFDWQSMQPILRRPKIIGKFETQGGLYEWGGRRFVPSWGGSMFEALMPTLLLDELRHAPRSLGRNAREHVEVQRRYAMEQLHYPVWGLSPSTVPGSDAYAEYGVKVLGLAGYKAGAVTPHAAALALLVAPDAATENLQRLARKFRAYGEYGFYDSIDPITGQVAYKYLCLNQAMILIAVANHLSDGAVQKHFGADPAIQAALPLLAHENFWD